MWREETLREWVQDHRVCWELASLSELCHHARVAVGYELRLFARHGGGARADPGCEECRELYEKLKAIALFALPREHRPTRYEVARFAASFHLRPESGWVPEVQLTLAIVHREGYLNPIDDCETKCTREIEGRLRALGAQSRAWSDSRSTDPADVRGRPRA